MAKWVSGTITILIVMTLYGCQSPRQLKPLTAEGAAPSAGQSAPPPPPPLPNSTPAPISFSGEAFRYLGANIGTWQQDPAARNFSDFYTRLVLYSNKASAGPDLTNPEMKTYLRDYNAENRGWLARVFQTETDSATVIANIQLSDPDVKVAIPLFSVTHVSGRDLGNTWATNFTQSHVQAPLMKIGPNTAITIHADIEVSTDLKSEGATAIVGAVTSAVQIAAPQSTLLTALSKADVNNAASAIDTVISNLGSRDIKEDIELGRLADTWSPGASVSLTGCAPFLRTEETSHRPPLDGYSPLTDNYGCGLNPDLDGTYNTAVGVWSLELTCPRLSVFDPRDMCHAIANVTRPSAQNPTALDYLDANLASLGSVKSEVANAVSDGQILIFNLSSQITIPTFVQSQTWYTSFISNKNAAAPDYTEFCADTISGLAASGLNKFDAALALRALVRQDPHLFGLINQFTSKQIKNKDADGKACITLFNGATGLNVASFRREELGSE